MGLSEPGVVRLRQVEIQIVESVAWASDSPLWEDLKAIGGFLPACRQVRSTIRTVVDSAPRFCCFLTKQ